MNKKTLFKFAFLNSIGVVIYTFLVTLIMQNGEKLFGKMDSIVGIVAFLLLFVLSAAIVGSLVLAKPLMLYIDGAKKEGLKLLLYTLGILFATTLVIFLVLVLIK